MFVDRRCGPWHWTSSFARELPLSAVGMRMGATIVGTAAAAHDLELSSFAMWDPCKSGRAYARELAMLGALRRDANAVGLGESTKMLEYPLSDKVARHIGDFTLIESDSSPLAERVLVVVRDDRTVSDSFRSRWDAEHAEWATTSEQESLLETELPRSVQPASTIAQLRAWLTADEALPSPFSSPPRSRDAVVTERSDSAPVRERVVELGNRRMFGIVTEPMGDVHGPLLVMVNGINEDHVGPARLWVDASRRWAALGLRCVRFDFSELGESPWLPGQPERPVFDWTQRYDIANAIRALIPASPDESVLIGLCSGAQIALEAALELEDPRPLRDQSPGRRRHSSRSAEGLRNSDRETVRSSAHRFEKILKHHPWIDETAQGVSRLVLLGLLSEGAVGARQEQRADAVGVGPE